MAALKRLFKNPFTKSKTGLMSKKIKKNSGGVLTNPNRYEMRSTDPMIL